jgi:hypothetical protein
MNQGALLLRATNKSLSQIVAETGASKTIASYWRSAERKPLSDKRDLLFELYAIPRDSWDQEIDGTEAPSDEESSERPSLSAVNVGPRATAVDQLQAHVDRIEARLKQAEADKVGLRDWAAIASARTRALEVLARVNGDLSPSDEDKIARSASWKRIQSAIAEALRPYPDAARALAEALEGEKVQIAC